MIGNRNLLLYNTENRNSLSLQLHHCGIQHCTPNYHFHISMRPYHIIHFVLDGKGTFSNETGTHNINKGEAFIIPAGSSAHYTADHHEPWKYCWIGIYADNNNPYLNALFSKNPVIKIQMELSMLERLILDIISVTDPRATNIDTYNENDFLGEQFIPITLPSQALEANSKLLHLLARLIETQTKNHFQLSTIEDYALVAKSYIDEHYSEPIKILDVADTLHIHPNYLSHVFYETYHQTPKAYLNSFRLHKAALLLTLTDQSVSNISTAVGFNSLHHFSKSFKNVFGCSPTSYRNRK